jgi:hypothetical protein
MVAVDDAPEVRYHRARKAWPCAGPRGDGCPGEIGAGDLYAEVRHPGLSNRSFGKRFCLACAGALVPPSPNGSASRPAATTPPKPVNGVARPSVVAEPVVEEPPARETTDQTADETGLRSVVEPSDETGESVRRVVRLVVLWVLAVALSVGLLYGVLRSLDWFLQIMQQPMRPGGPT